MNKIEMAKDDELNRDPEVFLHQLIQAKPSQRVGMLSDWGAMIVANQALSTVGRR
jgi:hypothetical protein